MPSGVDQLDIMLGGGLPEASTTMIMGPSGTGKTTLGLAVSVQELARPSRGCCLAFMRPRPGWMPRSPRSVPPLGSSD